MIRRRALGLGALWLAVSAAALALPACYGRTCDPSFVPYGAGPGEGRMIDEDTWESSPATGSWLFFPGGRTYFFDAPPLGDRVPVLVHPYVSPSEIPRPNFTPASGNLAILSGLDTHRVAIGNASCSDYYIRVVLVAAPYPPTEPDAGVTNVADAGVGDGGDDGGP